MDKEIIDASKKQVEKAYANLFIVALDKGVDLNVAAQEVAELIPHNTFVNERIRPQGQDGVLFLCALSRAIGTTLDVVFSMSKKESQLMLEKVISTIDIEDAGISIGDGFQREGEVCFSVIKQVAVQDHKALFKLDFCRHAIFRINTYSLKVTPISKTGDYGTGTDYLTDSSVVWRGTSGPVKDFVDKVIDALRTSEEDIKCITIPDNVDSMPKGLTKKEDKSYYDLFGIDSEMCKDIEIFRSALPSRVRGRLRRKGVETVGVLFSLTQQEINNMDNITNEDAVEIYWYAREFAQKSKYKLAKGEEDEHNLSYSEIFDIDESNFDNQLISKSSLPFSVRNRLGWDGVDTISLLLQMSPNEVGTLKYIMPSDLDLVTKYIMSIAEKTKC